MADGPASKKRGALRQLTKDDDPDIDEDSAPTEAGTFKKASDDVMATRRILKVRRTPPPPAASNPFANIQLVTPAPVPTPTPIPDGVPKVAFTTEDKASAAQAGPGADLLLEASIRAGETVVDDKAEEKANGNGKTGEAAKEVVENGDKEEHAAEVKSSERPSTMTFQQVSSSTNAFGSFGTGFSSSAFSFGATSSSLGTATSFSFGSSGSVPAFGSKPAEGFSSLFGNKDSSSSSPIPATSQQNQAAVSLQEVPTETGEEKEKAVFTGDATLYEFVEKSWKERGKGELKLNTSEDDGKKARLVMRSKGNLRLLLNANLFPDMRLNKMDNRSVTFACANSAAGKNAVGLTTYAVKVKDSTAATDFMALVESHKGVKTEATAEVATTQDSGEKPEGSSSSQPADAGKESQPAPDTSSKDSQAASDADKESQAGDKS